MKEKDADSERLQAKTVYEIIRREGEKEMRRPANSLWWSGFAAGLAINSSFVAQGMLHAVLPEGGWRLPLESFGYSVGFLIVILGRLQLFTENTITPVLPIMAEFSAASLIKMLRLWAVVLAANLAGTFTVALFAKFVGFATAEQLTAFYGISRHAILSGNAFATLLLAIPAGFYVAALVWMLPSSKGFEVWIIIIMTYLIAIGGFVYFSLQIPTTVPDRIPRSDGIVTLRRSKPPSGPSPAFAPSGPWPRPRSRTAAGRGARRARSWTGSPSRSRTC